jgi:hypothetical protein
MHQWHGKHHVTCYEDDATVGTAVFSGYITDGRVEYLSIPAVSSEEVCLQRRVAVAVVRVNGPSRVTVLG